MFFWMEKNLNLKSDDHYLENQENGNRISGKFSVFCFCQNQKRNETNEMGKKDKENDDDDDCNPWPLARIENKRTKKMNEMNEK